MSDRVACLAGGLREIGVQPGDCVSVLSMNSSRYLECLFAIPWAGAVFNLVNIRWNVAEIAYSLNDCDVRILIVDDVFAKKAAEIKEKTAKLKVIVYAGEGECPEGMISYEQLLMGANRLEDAYRSGDDLAGISYTGGTTGTPKGVMWSHTSLMTYALTGTYLSDLPIEVRMLHCAPLFHIAGLGFLLVSFLLGGTQFPVPGFKPTDVAKVIKQDRVTALLLIPTMLQILLDAPDFNAADFTSVKHIMYGASPMPLGTIDKARQEMPDVGFLQGYGMTECGLVCMSSADDHSSEARESGRISSAGIAGPLQQVRIVDEQGNVLPSGSVGEITLRGPNLMLGYWEKPELTANTIVKGWLHTGDGGYVDEEGYIYIVDRMKDMIISGGENIYSCEVETAISQHPAVSQCAVIGIPSDEWGESVHAVVVPAPGEENSDALTLDALRDFCRERIAGYKCPRSLEQLESLPISGAGKILKADLRKPYWQGRSKQVS